MIKVRAAFGEAKKLIKSQFVRNVVIVATGTAGAQAITMAFTPLLTRIYSPEAFGVLGTFMAILALLTPISALAYPIAIVLPESQADARRIAQLSLSIAFLTAVVFAIIFSLYDVLIFNSFGLGEISSFSFLIPLAMFCMAAYQVLFNWLIRTRQFNLLAYGSIVHSLTLNMAKAGFGYCYPVALLLVFFGASGYAWHAFILWLGLRRKNAVELKLSMKGFKIKEVAKRYKDFPKFRAPQIFVNALSNNIPVVVISYYFSSREVGFFVLAWTVMSAPAVLIGQSVGSVFYSKIVSSINAGMSTSHMLGKAFAVLGAISFLPYASIVMFGEYVFEVVFGAEWAGAGVFASYLSVAILLGLIHRPCEAYIQATGKNRFYMWYELFFLVAMLLTFRFSFIFTKDIVFFVAVFSLVKSLYYLCLIVYSIFLSKQTSLVSQR